MIVITTVFMYTKCSINVYFILYTNNLWYFSVVAVMRKVPIFKVIVLECCFFGILARHKCRNYLALPIRVIKQILP